MHRMVWEMLDKFTGKPETVERDINRLRQNFRNFITVGTSDETTTQPSLIPTESGRNPGIIQREDRATLNWLAFNSGTTGQSFLELLESRRLFKRVLVLSHDRAEDKELWKKMTDFYASPNWRKKLRLQRIFQDEIIKLVENPPGEPLPETDVITPDAKNNFIADGKQAVILLIDLPPVRKESDSPLMYLIEEDRRRIKIDENRVGTIEGSVVWKALQSKFQESIGKLRVFCHPDHYQFLTAYLSRQVIEGALSKALAKTLDGDSDHDDDT